MISRIFGLYLAGCRGKMLGVKGIAAHLNSQGLTMRGKRWRKTFLHEMLSNRLYLGEYTFNKMEAKTHRLKPESEWISATVEAIISPEIFAQVEQRLESRSPVVVPPRVANSPTLLTGLVKCGACGATMTIATGKGGRYRYYKCTGRINNLAIGSSCTNSNVPMEKLDTLVLEIGRASCRERV